MSIVFVSLYVFLRSKPVLFSNIEGYLYRVGPSVIHLIQYAYMIELHLVFRNVFIVPYAVTPFKE